LHLTDHTSFLILMKTRLVTVLLFISLTAKSQTAMDYTKRLTSGLEQAWRLDSITLNSQYGDFKKATVFLFRLNNRAYLSYGPSRKTDTVSWFLEIKHRYVLLRLGMTREYEVDFLQRNHVEYLRLRNQILQQKNTDVKEYFFTRLNM
jgi:hypothetical protein